MDFLLVTVLSVGIFVGYNAQQAGHLNFVCRNEEEFHMCRSPCEPTCNNQKVNCSQSCMAGCFCRDGFVRASDRTCVTPEECNNRTRPECKENEEFLECGSPCIVNCSNINDHIFCTKPCQRGCFCKPNFVRDAKGNCVHPRQCRTAGLGQCPMNERYVRCINYCNTCWESGDCRSHYCTPGCDCKPGFYRNIYMQCVTIEECLAPLYDSSYPSLPGNCAENEVYSDCVNPCNDCASRGICDYEYCQPGCDCKSGYFRDERGVCVPEQFCFRRCSEDRVFNQCGPSCVSTCENYKRLLYHPCKQECVPGCFCPRNLVLGPNGRCIEPKYCPSERYPTCPPGEVFYQCLPTCRITCEALNASSVICSTECRPGCFCQPGFVKNKNGICIRPDECPELARPTCPAGEVYYNCVPTCRNRCDNWNVSKRCTRICRPGCFCRKGFVKTRDGRCVRPRNCPIVCGANEEFRSCGTLCPATCSNFRERRICAQGCSRGCFCKPGFVLGPNDRCIRPENCPPGLLTPESVGIDSRRTGTDDEGLIDDTTTTPSRPIESTQSVTNEPTRSDRSETTLLQDTTKLSASTATKSASTSTVSHSETTVSEPVSRISPSEAINSTSASTISPSVAMDKTSASTISPSEAMDATSPSTISPSEAMDATSPSTISSSVTVGKTSADTKSPTGMDPTSGVTHGISTTMDSASGEIIMITEPGETVMTSLVGTTKVVSNIPTEKTLAEDATSATSIKQPTSGHIITTNKPVESGTTTQANSTA